MSICSVYVECSHLFMILPVNYCSCICYCWISQDVSKEGKHEAAQECCPASIGDGDRCDEISFNPNAFTEFKLAGSQEVSIVYLP